MDPSAPTLARIRRHLPVVQDGHHRGRTVRERHLTREEQAASEARDDDHQIPRPTTKAACRPCPSCQAWRDGVTPDPECGHTPEEAVSRSRPCLWVGCSSTLYLDVHPGTGSMKLNFPHLDPEGMRESCAEDLADRGGMTLEDVGQATGLTRERIRQVELEAVKKLKRASKTFGLGLPDDSLDTPVSIVERRWGHP